MSAVVRHRFFLMEGILGVQEKGGMCMRLYGPCTKPSVLQMLFVLGCSNCRCFAYGLSDSDELECCKVKTLKLNAFAVLQHLIKLYFMVLFSTCNIKE